MLDVSQAEVLVRELQNLHELDRTAGLLRACGAAAIPPLARYLCESVPEVLFEPRRAAVEVLASLGAYESLLAYLDHPRSIADPVARLAEETVQAVAARALAHCPAPEVFPALLHAAEHGCNPGVIEALGTFQRPEAVSHLLRGLEDGLCESAATEALRQLGRRAEWPLLGALRTPQPSLADERPTSLRRRRRALALLAEIGPSPDLWPWIHPFLDDPDPALAVSAAKIAIRLGGDSERAAAVSRLRMLQPTVNWFLQGEILDTLKELEPR